MIVLTAIRKKLQDTSAVTTLATGGIYMVEVPQNASRPNIMLMSISGSDDWSHQGPDGLYQDIVRIYSRGDSFEDAVRTAAAVKAALNGWIGTNYGVAVKLTQHVNTTGDYQDAAKVFRQIDDFRVTYRLD